MNVLIKATHYQAEMLGVKYELEDAFNAGLYDSNTDGFTFVPTLLHPASTGEVRETICIKSTFPVYKLLKMLGHSNFSPGQKSQNIPKKLTPPLP